MKMNMKIEINVTKNEDRVDTTDTTDTYETNREVAEKLTVLQRKLNMKTNPNFYAAGVLVSDSIAKAEGLRKMEPYRLAQELVDSLPFARGEKNVFIAGNLGYGGIALLETYIRTKVDKKNSPTITFMSTEANALTAITMSKPIRDFMEDNMGKLEIVNANFLETNFRGAKFDLIIMNPPWSGGLGVAFIDKGINLLTPNGKLAFIMGLDYFSPQTVNFSKRRAPGTMYHVQRNIGIVSLRTGIQGYFKGSAWVVGILAKDKEIGSDYQFTNRAGVTSTVTPDLNSTVIIEKDILDENGMSIFDSKNGLSVVSDESGPQRFAVTTAGKYSEGAKKTTHFMEPVNDGKLVKFINTYGKDLRDNYSTSRGNIAVPPVRRDLLQ